MITRAYASAAIRATCEVFGVRPMDLQNSSRRAPPLPTARALLARVLRDTNASYPEIGRVLGGFDHESIMVAVRRADKMLAEDTHAREAKTSIVDRIAELTKQSNVQAVAAKEPLRLVVKSCSNCPWRDADDGEYEHPNLKAGVYVSTYTSGETLPDNCPATEDVVVSWRRKGE